MNATPGHTLVVELAGDWVRYRVDCPHSGSDRPCATWSASTGPCVCGCAPCQRGTHRDCQSAYIEDVGRKWCQASPQDECWFDHAVSELGTEILDFIDPISIPIHVELTGGSWDEPIEVRLASDLTDTAGDPT